MVFSSIPAYLDPANWQQQQPNNQSGGSNQAAGTHHFAPPPPPPPPPHPHGSGGAGSIRPGSMADRARLANIPMPEAALRCPRCESTNTKFCYFNNYSLSQPRHFCKTCRRYWTRGGALRNVPVGGGCRRNKRSKGTSSSNNSASKSPASSDGRQTASGSASTMSSGTSCDILGFGPQIPPLRFMAPLHHLTSNDFSAGDIGLNYGSNISALGGNDLNFHIGSAFASAASGGSVLGGGATSASSLLSSLGGLDQWRLQQAQQQIPFLGGLDSSSSNPGLYGYDHGGILEGSAVYGGGSSQVRGKMPSGGVLSQFASVKMEDSNSNQQQELNLSRQFLGLQGNNDNHHHYNWNINSSTTAAAAAAASAPTAWTDLSSFNSSSNTSDPL